jgi:ABC-2 type transport system permease protein
VSWAPYAAVVRKEFRQVRRDPRIIWILVAVPVIQLTLLGYAVNLDVTGVATAVVDDDRSPVSRSLAMGLLAGDTFRDAGTLASPGEAHAALAGGRASVVLVFPRGFAAALARGEPAPVQVLLDGADTTRARIAGAAAELYFQQKAVAQATARMARIAAARGRSLPLPRFDLRPRLFYNQRLLSRMYMVPGVAAILLLLVTTVVTAMGIAREREIGTIEQLLVTPIRPTTLMLGKMTPFALIGLFDFFLVLAVGAGLFDVPIRGPLPVLVLGSALYLLSTLALGLFISTVSRTQQQALMGALFFLLPAFLLSGFVSPIENMPHWLQPLTVVNPVRFYLEVLRAVLLKGAGLRECAVPLAALAMIGLALLAFATRRFHKRLG